MTEWFEEWFGEEYLHLYPHRDEADAARMVGLLRNNLPWQSGWRVLDVGCGAGRHAKALEAAGARVVGLDLSMSLLRRAHRLGVPLVRADMRWLPIRCGSMDLTVNLFTSFGYFEDDQQHADALAGMIGTTGATGWFVIDFLNADAVRRTLIATDTMELGGEEVMVTRSITADGRYVIKVIQTPDGRRFMERVRLFRPDDLSAMIEQAEVRVTHRFGDYDGSALRTDSRRCILFASRS